MINYVKIPLACPFKFVPSVATAGMHFDDDWACRRIQEFERKAYYAQKWPRAKTTKFQITSTIAPEDLFVLDTKGNVVKNLAWTLVPSGATSYNFYEVEVDLSDLPEGRYFLYLIAELLSFSKAALSEPIDSKDEHPYLLGFKFTNSFNDFGVAWTATGIEMTFYCEAAIMEFQPDRDRTPYVNQLKDISTLKATPARTFKLWIGEAPGVAEWVIDLMNRIFCCDHVEIFRPADMIAKAYQSTEGSKWEVSRVRGYPLIGATLEIAEAKNNDSLEMSDTEELTPGLVTSYEIQTGFFGPAATVPITDVEENS